MGKKISAKGTFQKMRIIHKGNYDLFCKKVLPTFKAKRLYVIVSHGHFLKSFLGKIHTDNLSAHLVKYKLNKNILVSESQKTNIQKSWNLKKNREIAENTLKELIRHIIENGYNKFINCSYTYNDVKNISI